MIVDRQKTTVITPRELSISREVIDAMRFMAENKHLLKFGDQSYNYQCRYVVELYTPTLTKVEIDDFVPMHSVSG